MEIDNLSVSLKTNGADDAIQKIYIMAKAVDHLANSAKAIDAAKLQEFANGLKLVSSSAPNKSQANNMSDFADGISKFVAAISGANITQVANDMSNLSGAVQGMGAKSVKTLTNAANAMGNLSQQTKQAAQAANSVKTDSTRTSGQNNAQQITNSFRQLNGELNKVAISADSIGGKLSKMGLLVPTKQFKSLGEQADKIKAKYEELRNTIARGLESGKLTEGSDKLATKQRELEALRNEYDRLILKQRELALAGDGFKINPTIQAGLDGFKKGFNGVISVVKGGFVSAIKSANHHISSFIKNLSGANSAQKAFQKTMNSMKSLPTKIAKEITRLGKMLKLMVVRKALRAVISEIGNGFQSLAIHSDQFNESMSNLINGSKQLGYSFSAMVSPLINALAPALVYIIDLLIKLLNIINQVFSALSGATTWNRAKKFTDSWRDSITGAGKAAGKAAKEIKKTVLGFDELNQLQDNKNSGGGGGSDITDMFETVKIDPKWKDFADWLKEMWKNKDFYDLGKLAGEKLRDWLESIPWDKIRKTANDLGKATATLINGFVEVERLGYDIGMTVAQGVNTVFEYINGFVHNLHWASIGKFIADTFNGFFENIDWDLIKDTVVTGLRGIATAIWQFIQEFHWDNISDFIKNGLDTIAEGIKAFFNTPGYDERGFKLNGSWAERLGKELGHQLALVFKDKELWREVGEALGEMVQGAIDFLSEFVSELKVEDIRASLKEMVDGFFDTVDTEELGKLVADLIDLAVGVAFGFLEDNISKFAEEGKKFLVSIWENLDSDTKDSIGKAIGAVLVAAVGMGITSMQIALAGSLAKAGISKLIANALFGGAAAGGAGAAAGGAASGELLGSATVAGSSMGGALVGGLMALLAGSEVGKWVGKKIFPEDKDLYEGYKGITGTFKMLGDFFVDFYPGLYYLARDFAIGVKRDVSDAASWINEKWTDAANKLAEKWDEPLMEKVDNIKAKVSEFKQDAGQKLNDAVLNFADFSNKVVYRVDEVKTSLGDFKDKATENLKTFNDNVSEKVNSVKEKFGDLNQKITEKKDSIVASFADLNAKAEEKFENLKSKVDEFGTKWNERWADAKSKLDEAKTNIHTTLENMKSDFTSFKEKVSEAFSKDNWTFSGVMDGLKKTFDDAKRAIGEIWNSIADKLNGEFEVGSSKFKINLPKFAQGGFPSENGLFMANSGELVGKFSNGKTAVANNEQIISGIERGVYSAVSAAMANNNGGSAYISNEIVVDGEVIARSITKAQEKMNRRYSPQTV